MPIGLDELWHGYKPLRCWLFLEGIKAFDRYRDGWDVLTGTSIGIGSADPFAIAFW